LADETLNNAEVGTKAASEKIVTKSRIVAAVLAELGVTRAVVMFTCNETSETYSCRITCELTQPFSNSQLSFTDLPESCKSGKAVCCFAGHRIVFETKQSSELGSWMLPDSLKMMDLRHERRWSFPHHQYSAEIIGNQGSFYGYAVDINQDCLAIDMDITHDLTLSGEYKIIIRMINTNNDVFFRKCKLALLTPQASSGQRGIFQLECTSRTAVVVSQLGAETKRRQSQRLSIASGSIVLSGSPLNDFRTELDFVVENVSAGGMSVGLREGNKEYGLLPGMIVKSRNPELSMLVVWADQDIYGLRPLLGGGHEVSQWYRYLNEVNPPLDRKISISRKEFSDLLTHSGLLKGSRRDPFGVGIENHFITLPEIETPLLTQRTNTIDSDRSVKTHISAKRVSENTWFVGDGIAMEAQPGTYSDLLSECLRVLSQRARESSLFPRYFSAIWHESVKPSADWGNAVLEKNGSERFEAINSAILKFKSKSTARIYSLENLGAHPRNSIFSNFSPVVVESLVGIDGTHPILNAELNRFGPYHKAQSKVVSIQENIHLIAHRIMTYGVWSSTGVTNSVFVLVPNNCDGEQLKEGLRALTSDEIAYGTDDFLVIFPNEYNHNLDPELFPKNRTFTYLIHDLRQQQPPEEESSE